MRFVFSLMAWALAASVSYSQEIIIDEPYVDPYEGVWIPWPEPGSGLFIDQQNETLVVAVFTYLQSGVPVWYLASGQIKDGVFLSTAYRYAGGSCINCAYVLPDPGTGIPVRLEFTGRTIGWLTWAADERIPIRALPFDSPRNSGFFAESKYHGIPNFYDMSGRWLFLATRHDPNLFPPFDVRFNAMLYIEPGGTAWAGNDSSFVAFCRDDELYGPFLAPQCIFENVSLDLPQLVFSSFWADIETDAVLGYLGDPKFGNEGDIRGDDLVYGFRLTGPVEPFATPSGEADPALYIDKGVWIIPGKPGSGLMLDWQDDTLVYTIFTYEEDGTAIWYQGAGAVENGIVDNQAFPFSWGTCLSCEYADSHKPGDPIPIRFEFTSKTTAWLTFDNGEPIPIRSMAFDSPNYRLFGSPTSLGQPALYGLRGRWVFVSTEGIDEFYREVRFTKVATYPGRVAWSNEDGTIRLRCDADYERFASPQCRLIEFDSGTGQRLFSAHWADIGEDQIIGYQERPLSGEDGKTRGDKLIFGFRLSGPGPD